MMRRLLPSPWLSFGLLGGWLLLTRTFSPGQWLLGLAVALALPLLMSPLRPRPGSLRNRRVLLRLILRVGRDVGISGLQVWRAVLRGRSRPANSAFVTVPLDVRDPHALAALAVITSVIPGTVWCELAPDRSALLMHVFDLDDEARFIAHYKADYELPLKEIFE